MAQNTTLNGVTYSIPDPGDTGWGASLTAFLVAIAPAVLQKSGGVFTLTADADFGAAFGLKSAYFSTRASNPSTAGVFRLANPDTFGFRNFANNGNLLFSVNASDGLLFNGSPIGQFVSTADRAVITNGSGTLAVSPTTATEIGYVSGATSAIQTQLNNKLPLAGGTLTGDLTLSDQHAIIFKEQTGLGTDSVTIKAPDNVTASYTLKLPLTQASGSQQLTNDGSGNLSWTTGTGSGVVNSGTANALTYYATTGATVSQTPDLSYNNTTKLLNLNPSGSNSEIRVNATSTFTAKVALSNGSGTLSIESSDSPFPQYSINAGDALLISTNGQHVQFSDAILHTAVVQIASNQSVTGVAILNDITGATTSQGLTSGRSGQIIHVQNTHASSTTTLVHNGSGTQKFLLPGATNYTLAPRTGCTIWYDGTNWYVVDK